MLFLSLGGKLDLQNQEALLLKALGLKAKPSPKTLAPVPPLLWKMFQRKTKSGLDDADAKDVQQPCWVEEFQVPGNIIRVFPDQGRLPDLEWGWVGGVLVPLDIAISQSVPLNLAVVARASKPPYLSVRLDFAVMVLQQ
ncbi:hypothetical protein JD844_034023 [Phrynosoma platyrhinos]|uniref:Uncharacterized protein n=1 Tax=Phrynosoma platyrhinos TaxID=52577 RepID=A0ABQ7T808_PHRPL|nr:hypothetical protein JD844_034023 [Phrynosoma platyrhinos]